MDLAIIVETMVILGILGGFFVMIVIFIRIVSAILGGGQSSQGGTKGALSWLTTLGMGAPLKTSPSSIVLY